MTVSSEDALVIGAGIIGLTTAIRLAETGISVTVATADDPLETTSVLASAMVGPSFAPPPMGEWAAATDAVFRGPESEAPGVAIRRGRLIAEPEGFIHPAAKDLPGFAPCNAAETPPGFGTAFWIVVPLLDMPAYMGHLVARATSLDVRIERRSMASLDEAASLAPLVINCAGLGARKLVPDTTLTALRGPYIVVRNPGVDTFVMSGPPGPTTTSYHPHGDKVVLGGSMTETWDTTPDEREAAEIIARCARVEPKFKDAEILDHRVGLRPARSQPRLERQQLGGSTIIHNYGHGGSGVTFSWGCAAHVLTMLGA